jgi:hypothetical protein
MILILLQLLLKPLSIVEYPETPVDGYSPVMRHSHLENSVALYEHVFDYYGNLYVVGKSQKGDSLRLIMYSKLYPSGKVFPGQRQYNEYLKDAYSINGLSSTVDGIYLVVNHLLGEKNDRAIWRTQYLRISNDAIVSYEPPLSIYENGVVDVDWWRGFFVSKNGTLQKVFDTKGNQYLKNSDNLLLDYDFSGTAKFSVGRNMFTFMMEGSSKDTIAFKVKNDTSSRIIKIAFPSNHSEYQDGTDYLSVGPNKFAKIRRGNERMVVYIFEI